MKPITCLKVLLIMMTTSLSAGQPAGERPYEMVRAGRVEDDHPPLVDFEDLAGWTLQTHDAEATFALSREKLLWGDHVGKLTYRGAGTAPCVTLRPPAPVPIAGPFDCVNLWLYGNNSPWFRFPDTPQVDVTVLLLGPDGDERRIAMARVGWYEWWLVHLKLSAGQQAALKEGAAFSGIEIARGANKEDRFLYFDNLSFFQEELPPLEFVLRPKRGVDPLPGQPQGLNTGDGRLPFPTREETILPDNLTERFTTELTRSGDTFLFRFRGDDGVLDYRYTAATGTLSDVTARWEGRGQEFLPLSGGGPVLTESGSPETAQLLSCDKVDDAVVSRWRLIGRERTAEVTYTFRLWGKSLVVDVQCPGGRVAEFRIGRTAGVKKPRLVTLPYLTFQSHRPAVLVTGDADTPLFVSAWLDWYRSNASELFAANGVEENAATLNGGSTYIPTTDGKRNDCFERLFLTVSPRFEEVLPNIANPRSPWIDVMGERVWAVQAAADREKDYARWVEIARYGMTNLIVLDHEPGWRDGGESFTLRTRAAPGKGGDEGQADFSRKMHDLGFRYGLYNNYTDFAPVNRHWNEDYVARQPDTDWRRTWARCYNLKPSRAVELEEKLAPVIQEKFQLSTGYCDVHSIVTPWRYCDYDARVPGAGMFAATYYAYGEILLHQQRHWNGPVHSEGGMHWMYAGLTDGNYAQDPWAALSGNPWLVDFDLRKIHPLSCNFGMGKPSMFYGAHLSAAAPDERSGRLDRFLAATVAFGHTGYLPYEAGMEAAVRSYFLIQQLALRYAGETVAEIRYADANGRLLDSTAAVATGVWRCGRIATRYSNGLLTVVNASEAENWRYDDGIVRFDLPPNGYAAVMPSPDSGQGELFVTSGMIDGHRADYVDSPTYVYVDGRGAFTRFPKAAADGPAIFHRREGGIVEAIPLSACTQFAVALDRNTATAVALDKTGNETGPAETRFARGLVYIISREGAFSYLLTPAGKPAVVARCNREKVLAGETVGVTAKGSHEVRIATDAQPGDRVWKEFDGAWIDFTVVPLVDATLTAAGDELQLDLEGNPDSYMDGVVTLGANTRPVRLKPEEPTVLRFPLPPTEEAGVVPLPVTVSAGDLTWRRTWWLQMKPGYPLLADLLRTRWEMGQCLRGGSEGPLQGASGAAVRGQGLTCGGITRQGLWMHPPFQGAVGYVFARFPPVDLPADVPAVFRCAVGKGDGSDPGDGILFRVVVEAPGAETVIAEKHWKRHAWTDLEADLAPWAGQTVRIRLIADVGPDDNPTGDWACWSQMRIEGKREILTPIVHAEKPGS